MEGYVIAMIIIFLSAFVVSVVFCTFCYKKGNNKKKKHGQRPARIDVRKRNRASISGQTYDSGGTGGDMHGNGNGAGDGGVHPNPFGEKLHCICKIQVPRLLLLAGWSSCGDSR
nr:uncharacterized protein LOC117279973 [Nicotiana tomentosiformis]